MCNFGARAGQWFENHLVSSKLNVNKPHTSLDNCEAMNPFHDKDPSLKQLPGVKLLLGVPNQQIWPKISVLLNKQYWNTIFCCNYPSSCLHLVCLKWFGFQPRHAQVPKLHKWCSLFYSKILKMNNVPIIIL